MTNQSDNFSYVKPNGKRALRAWVLATLAIFLVLAVISGYSVFAAQERQAEIVATPRPAATSGSYFNTNAYAGSDSYPNDGCRRDQHRCGGSMPKQFNTVDFYACGRWR